MIIKKLHLNHKKTPRSRKVLVDLEKYHPYNKKSHLTLKTPTDILKENQGQRKKSRLDHKKPADKKSLKPLIYSQHPPI